MNSLAHAFYHIFARVLKLDVNISKHGSAPHTTTSKLQLNYRKTIITGPSEIELMEVLQLQN